MLPEASGTFSKSSQDFPDCRFHVANRAAALPFRAGGGYLAGMAEKKTKKSAVSGDSAPDPELDGLDFEAALAELEGLVASMESGELGLEASLKAFERGVALTRHCQNALKNAELKVKVLTEQNTLEDLDVDTLDDA